MGIGTLSNSQSIEEWLSYLCKTKLVQDQTSVISDKQLASKMLRGAGLPREKKAQVLFNRGGVCDPFRTEAVLRVTFPKINYIERR